jgi:hypothetical protein
MGQGTGATGDDETAVELASHDATETVAAAFKPAAKISVQSSWVG